MPAALPDLPPVVPLPLGSAVLLGWLLAYCVALVPLSILGGWLLQRLRPSHKQMQHLISVVAGLMLGIAVLHMLPHALEAGPRLTPHQAGAAMLGGMLVTFFLLRWFHFHQHEPAAIVTCTEDHDHDLHDHDLHDHDLHDHDSHDHDSHPQANRPAALHSHPPQRFSWTGALLGMGLHTLIDGFALGAAMQAHGDGAWPAFGVLLAIALHKPLDAMSITSMMMQQGWSAAAQTGVNIAYAALCPLGAAILLLGLGDPHGLEVAVALAVSAGVFVCIALSDLLPEMEFHSHDRTSLTIALLVGVAIAAVVGWLEPGHTH